MRLVVLICLGFAAILKAQTIGWPVELNLGQEPRQLEHISNLSTIELPSVFLGGQKLHSLSALTYSKDDNILYALTDNARLFWFRINFDKKGNLLNLHWLATYKLRGKTGKFLRGKKNADSEGMDIIKANNGIKGDSSLMISFERKHRVWLMSTRGVYLKKVTLPAYYAKGTGFHRKNKGLESVVRHQKFGILSSLEIPAKDNNLHSIFSFKPYKAWQIPRIKFNKAAVTAMENMPNADILLLERSYSEIFTPLVIGLKQVRLGQGGKLLSVKQLAIFNNVDDWYMDNFEGLTHIKDNPWCI